MDRITPRSGYDAQYERTELPLTPAVLAHLSAHIYVFARAWSDAIRYTLHRQQSIIKAHCLANAIAHHAISPAGAGVEVAPLLSLLSEQSDEDDNAQDEMSEVFVATLQRVAGVIEAIAEPHSRHLAGECLDAAATLIQSGWIMASAGNDLISASYALGFDYLLAREPETEYLMAAEGSDVGEVFDCQCASCLQLGAARILFAQWQPGGSSLHRLHTMLTRLYALPDDEGDVMDIYSDGEDDDEDDDSDFE